MTNIYVGNLLYATTEDELVEFFGQWGEVERATLVYDRETGRPRGFAFVEMPDAADAAKAVAAARGAELNGRPLTVNEARPRGSGGGGGGPRPGHPHRGSDEVHASAGYGNRSQPAITNPAPPPEDLPKDDDEEDLTSSPVAESDEPVRRSGGYTNRMHR